MQGESVEREIAKLAAKQYGVFSRRQVFEFGVPTRFWQHRLAAGRWERVAPGVFRVAGTPSSWLQSLMTAELAWGAGSAISHLAGAALWRFTGFVETPAELTVPLNRRRKECPGIIHRNVLAPIDTTVVRSITVTTPARTLLDIAGVAPADKVEEALDDALRRKIVSVQRLQRYVAGNNQGRPGVKLLRMLVDARDGIGIPQSPLETRFLRLLKKAGITVEVQYEVWDRSRLIGRVDFAIPELRIVIEADSRKWHSSRSQWEHDRARRNDLTLAGWTVLQLTSRRLGHAPEDIVAAIHRLIDERRARLL